MSNGADHRKFRQSTWLYLAAQSMVRIVATSHTYVPMEKVEPGNWSPSTNDITMQIGDVINGKLEKVSTQKMVKNDILLALNELVALKTFRSGRKLKSIKIKLEFGTKQNKTLNWSIGLALRLK